MEGHWRALGGVWDCGLGPKPQSHTPLDLSPGLWFWGVGCPNHSPTPLGFLALDCGLGVLGVRTTVWRLLESVGDCWRVLERAGDCWRVLERAGDCWRGLETAGEGWRGLETAGEYWISTTPKPKHDFSNLTCRWLLDHHHSQAKA